MMTAQDRYLHDPVFHTLVDTIYMAIDKLQYTPTEIRDAAMLAALHWEMRHVRPVRVTVKEREPMSVEEP